MTVRGNIVHMHHIQLVLDRFQSLRHGLSKSDVDRDDRMKWESAQDTADVSVADFHDDFIGDVS